jgi:hypothetical protein
MAKTRFSALLALLWTVKKEREREKSFNRLKADTEILMECKLGSMV